MAEYYGAPNDFRNYLKHDNPITGFLNRRRREENEENKQRVQSGRLETQKKALIQSLSQFAWFNMNQRYRDAIQRASADQVSSVQGAYQQWVREKRGGNRNAIASANGVLRDRVDSLTKKM